MKRRVGVWEGAQGCHVLLEHDLRNTFLCPPTRRFFEPAPLEFCTGMLIADAYLIKSLATGDRTQFPAPHSAEVQGGWE